MKHLFQFVLAEKQSLFSIFVGLMVAALAFATMNEGHNGMGLLIVGISLISLSLVSIAIKMSSKRRAVKPAPSLQVKGA
ncbi:MULTISPECIES: hypothetical protein [Shewanella]|uniref:Uncharacterized protein n=1 Tax=Shewanella marisflavi TaxID=260364 RepID=A0AAC9U0J3_9GAMM|nr:hypothetical protein [Shewanella marisflavi]ASJ97451.1 hypothetical protein CFF01_13150 [Shewanella marisflavi]MCL1040766.1 hypothetical protein [Shewanella marisflavi]